MLMKGRVITIITVITIIIIESYTGTGRSDQPNGGMTNERMRVKELTKH